MFSTPAFTKTATTGVRIARGTVCEKLGEIIVVPNGQPVRRHLSGQGSCVEHINELIDVCIRQIVAGYIKPHIIFPLADN